MRALNSNQLSIIGAGNNSRSAASEQTGPVRDAFITFIVTKACEIAWEIAKKALGIGEPSKGSDSSSFHSHGSSFI